MKELEPIKGKWNYKSNHILYMKYGLNYEKEKLVSQDTIELFEDIKSAIEWYKTYIDIPLYYFVVYPKQLKEFWKYVGENPDTTILRETEAFRRDYNIWLLNKAFEDITKVRREQR